MKYRVKIKEYIEREVKVESNSEKEAESIVRDKYDKEEIILDCTDWMYTDYEVNEIKED